MRIIYSLAFMQTLQNKNLTINKIKMKKFKFTCLVLIIFSMIAISCTHEWIKDVKINGIEFEKIRYSCNESDTISIICFMKYDNIIQGYPCKKGWIHFTKEKDLKLFCLSELFDVENIILSENCWILDAQNCNFTTVVFPNDTIIQAYPISGGCGVKGARTKFYKSGKLKSFFPSKNFVISGTEFKKSIFNSVQISSDGNLTQD